jgi:hypothetical protein
LPVLSEPYIPRNREQLASLIKEQNLSYEDLSVPGHLGKTTAYKIITGRQPTTSRPKAELIAKRLGKRFEDLFRPQYEDSGEGE